MMQEIEEQKPARGVDEYWAVVRRRKWWIIGPLFFGWLLVFVSAWLIPARYTSESELLIEKPKIPDKFVIPNVQMDLSERLETITQQVLSRGRLLAIINRFHLYESFLTPTADDQLRKMRSDIKIELVHGPTNDEGKRQLTAFKLQYTADKGAIAQQVNAQMVSFFIDENVKASQQQSEATTQFLDTQLKNAEQALGQQESKLQNFEKQHAGEMPEEAQTNIQMMTGLQQQLQALIETRNRALQQQTYLTSLAAQYDAAGINNLQSGAPQSIDQQIEGARTALADMQARYTPQHPDVKKLKEEIAKLEELKNKQAGSGDDTDSSANDDQAGAAATTGSADKTPPAGDAGNGKSADADTSAKNAGGDDIPDARPGTTASQLQAMAPLMQIQSELKSNRMEIQNREEEIRAVEAKIQQLQAVLGGSPGIRAEMLNLTRDYAETKRGYDQLLEKRNASELATNLQRQQQGENFRIIDPPSLPEKASFPDRFKFSLAGLAVGLGLAVLFGAGTEYLDDRIRNEQDLAQATPLPILVEIPPIKTDAEIRSGRWKPWVAVAALVLVIIIIPTGIVYAFYWG
jgi:uncharacterized protein involved in exopolysaccharide biosynthesis